MWEGRLIVILSGLSRDDNGLIGFVIDCLYTSAITMEEIRQWSLYMIDKYETNELPLYIFDLIDFDDAIYKIDGIVGFVAGWQHTQDDHLALCGIAVARGFKLFDEPAPSSVLIKMIQERPWLFEKYKKTFPFIDVSRVEKRLSIPGTVY